jgi:hypothetical protein
MNIDTLIKLAELLKGGEETPKNKITDSLIGKYVIIRTYSAGVHAGILSMKEGKEVILTDARRLWHWNTTNKGISLSEVANTGLAKDGTRVCESVPQLWLEAIEIIPCSPLAESNIKSFEVYRA